MVRHSFLNQSQDVLIDAQIGERQNGNERHVSRQMTTLILGPWRETLARLRLRPTSRVEYFDHGRRLGRARRRIPTSGQMQLDRQAAPRLPSGTSPLHGTRRLIYSALPTEQRPNLTRLLRPCLRDISRSRMRRFVLNWES